MAGELSTMTRLAYSQDENGNWVVTQRYEDLIGEPELPEDARNVKRVHEKGRYTLECDIGSSKITFRISGATSQEPIETHPKLKYISAEIWEKWATWKKDPNDATLNKWTPKTDLPDLYRLYNKGVTSYLVPTVIVRQQITEQQAPYIEDLGKISPLPNDIKITIVNGANWMKTSAEGQVTVEGSTNMTGAKDLTWDNSYEWRMSGPEGWDEWVYGTKANGQT